MENLEIWRCVKHIDAGINVFFCSSNFGESLIVLSYYNDMIITVYDSSCTFYVYTNT